MNVARLNFSHGSHEEHLKKIELIKRVRKQLNMPIAIMLDTKGPEYRTGRLADGSVMLNRGEHFTFTTEDVLGDRERVSVSYKNLPQELEVGDTVLVNNGLMVFRVLECTDTEVRCEVVAGGELTDRKRHELPRQGAQADLPQRAGQGGYTLRRGKRRGLHRLFLRLPPRGSGRGARLAGRVGREEHRRHRQAGEPLGRG